MSSAFDPVSGAASVVGVTDAVATATGSGATTGATVSVTGVATAGAGVSVGLQAGAEVGGGATYADHKVTVGAEGEVKLLP